MKRINCNICDEKEIALNDSIKIDGIVYCKSCFDSQFSDQNNLNNKLIENELDPTICSFCNKDYGQSELNKISIYCSFVLDLK
jgi:hypothetical protein